MQSADFDQVLAEIRRRAKAAVESTGMGAKPFAKKNGMGETVVRDLVQGHNKDVQLSTLIKIAAGADKDLLDLLPSELVGNRRNVPTGDALEQAIREALPGMRRVPQDRRAAYLADTVLELLQLPPARQSTPGDGSSEGDLEGDVPPPGSTM